MSHAINIFLVDDHPIVRNGLKALVERLGNYKVTGEYDNGEELINEYPFQSPPDLIIMDLAMPVMDGTQTVIALKQKGSKVPVLILTLETDERTIINLFRLGIRGYLPKSSTADVLRKAISDVTGTGYYHNEMLAKALLSPNEVVLDERQQVLGQVSQRERDFLKLVCDEKEPTYEQIANAMEVSRRTVDGYRESLFTKFNIRSKTGLVLFAIKYGIVKSE
ncbi:MAG TPA: response regulator transcription factor [Flavipsychrobacter sp.]